VQGTRPAVPPGTPADYAALMQACWQDNPVKRPTFEQVLLQVKRMLAEQHNPTAANENLTTDYEPTGSEVAVEDLF
jgi:Protein tyrosine and serine/threonine kinase